MIEDRGYPIREAYILQTVDAGDVLIVEVNETDEETDDSYGSLLAYNPEKDVYEQSKYSNMALFDRNMEITDYFDIGNVISKREELRANFLSALHP